MADLTFEQVLEAAERLSAAERAALVERLRATLDDTELPLTRHRLIAELAQKRAEGAFEQIESLYGKFATPGVEWNDDELEEFLHHIRTEWEAELDELADDN
jgi:hypothetical protein